MPSLAASLPMPRAGEHLERVEVGSREALRAWLEAHHGQRDSIWLVTAKKGTGSGHVPYGAIVEEALCFGWVDSLPRALDDTRTMILLSRRRPASAWSAANKARVERLTAAGQMRPPGLAVVEAAKASGRWTALDAVETLAVPADLEDALKAEPGAARYFAAFPPSSRRGILEWIAAARKVETRLARIRETARLARDNIKANHPAGRNAGPRPEDDRT